MTSSCLPRTGSESFQPLFSRSRLSHSQLLIVLEIPLQIPPVLDAIRSLDSFSGVISPRLTSDRASMTNLPLYIDIPQPTFQDSYNHSASFISDHRHHAVSLSPLRCSDNGVVPIMSNGISFIEQPPQSAVCSTHTAALSSLVDSSVSRYTHHASSTVVSIPPFRRSATPVPPTCVVLSPSPVVFSSATQE